MSKGAEERYNSLSSYPYNLLRKRGPGSGDVADRNPIWELELQRLRWPAVVDVTVKQGQALPFVVRTVSDSGELPRGSRCRWLLSLDRAREQPKAGGRTSGEAALAEWGAWWRKAGISLKVDRRIADGLRFRAWYAAPAFRRKRRGREKAGDALPPRVDRTLRHP